MPPGTEIQPRGQREYGLLAPGMKAPVRPRIRDDIPPLAEAVAALKEALAEARAAEDHLGQVLSDGGWLA